MYRPGCHYNLRMLHAPRCPECGRVFRWQALLGVTCPRCGALLGECDGAECPRCRLELNWPRLPDEAAALDRNQYEYAPRPVRAALRAFVSALNPWRFWRRIPLESPPVLPRLRIMRRVTVVTGLAGLLMVTMVGHASPHAWLKELRTHGAFLWVLALTLPLVTMLALPRFGFTLGQFHIRREQVTRVLTYASLALGWTGVALGVLAAVGVAFNIVTSLRSPGAPIVPTMPCMISAALVGDSLYGGLWLRGTTGGLWLRGTTFFDQATLFNYVALGAVACAWLWWWVFLYLALRRYLRLNRRNAWALLLSTQLIGLLLIPTMLLWLDIGTRLAGNVMWWIEKRGWPL